MSALPVLLETVPTAMEGLESLDPRYPEPEAVRVLRRPENRGLLDYVTEDPFGSHVFPGDRPSTAERFFADADRQLAGGEPFFLWATIPVCRYHCFFCQFPIVIAPRDAGQAEDRSRRWVDANLREARLWLDRVPRLREAPVGEFCLFGGTPTALPDEQLERLLDFYLTTFHFTPETTLRIEGSPDTLTRGKLELLRRKGVQKITFGVQSFDDRSLKMSGRHHTADEARQVAAETRRLGFERVDADLIYGLLDQSVDSFERDVREMIALGFQGVVVTKLHLRPFDDTGTAIAGVSAPWQSRSYRDRLAAIGHRWPSLGEQYQMRELAVDLMEEAGRTEYPTMYFQSPEVGCGTWKALVLDQDKQRVEIGIGLGGSSSTAVSSASITVDPAGYFAAVEAGELPLEALGLDRRGQIASSLRRALSTCQPLRDDLHQDRFPESSLFDTRWGPVFAGLEKRGLARIDPDERRVELTRVGKTLVEAILNTEIR